MNRIVWISLLALCGCESLPQPAEPGPSGAEQALEYRLARMRDERGNIDPNGRRNALAQRQVNVDFAAMTDGGGIGNLGWTEHGPDNIGGRSRTLLVHPTQTSRLYAGSVGGGVWRSNNSGQTWFPLDDFMGNLAISCLAFEPGNPDVIYAGTGEGYGNGDAIFGAGIFKSTNAGNTWAQMPTTIAFGNVNRIAVSHANPNVMLVSTAGGIRRTANGGASWTTVRPGSSLQVLIDPNDASRCVAHWGGGGSGASPHGIAWSDDAGLTWQNATGGFSPGTRIEIAYAPSVSGRLYAVIAGFQCWRSDDGGQSWVQRTTAPINGDSFPWYCNAIWVDPTNSNWVVVGNVRLWRSSNGGQTFTEIGSGGINTAHPHSDVHRFVEHPGYDGVSNRTFYVCTDGGVWQTTDIRNVTIGSGWQRRDAGFRTVQYYGVSGHGPSGRIVGGTQDNGSHLIDSATGNSADIYFGNDGGVSQIDPNDPDVIYGEAQNMRLHRTLDGGQSVTQITAGLTDFLNGCTNFIAPLVLSTDDPSYLYAGGCSLWRCANPQSILPIWASIRGPIGSNISAIAVAPNDVDTVWVGYNDGRIYRTTNATTPSPNWVTVENNGSLNVLPNKQVTRILLDRADPTKAWVAFGGYTAGNLRYSDNNGQSWSIRTGAGAEQLPDAPVYGIAQHPLLLDFVYVATEVGVFGSSDAGATWSSSNDGPADVACYDITFLHGSMKLLVGTHGRGMWTTAIHEPGVFSFGTGCAGSNGTPALMATPPRLGSTVTITGTNLVPDRPVWLVQGQSNTSWFGNALPADLGLFQAPGCFLRVRPDLVRDGFADSNGVYTGQLPIAANTALLGMSTYLQLFPGDLAANGFGRTATNGLQLRIGN